MTDLITLLKADLELAAQSLRCEPVNRNLNTLTCKHCKRQWYFEPPDRSTCKVLFERQSTTARNHHKPYVVALLKIAEAFEMKDGFDAMAATRAALDELAEALGAKP
jgi:hypothetical protein